MGIAERDDIGEKEKCAKRTTAAKGFGLTDATIQGSILGWRPGRMRGQTVYFRGYEVYLDCYNANPVAMEDAFRYFDKRYWGEKTYVLGWTGELGEFSEEYHRKLAGYFRDKNAIIFAIAMEMQVFYDGLAVISEAMKILYFEETAQAKVIFCKRIQGNILMKVNQRHRLWELLDNEIAEYRMQKNEQMQYGC